MPSWFLATLAGFKLPTQDCCSIALAELELTAVVEGFMMTNKQDLDLSSNLISSLPASVFANSPLSSLSLANNSLTALQPKLFSGLSNLLHLGKLFHFFSSFNREDILDFFMNFIQHCFICRPPDSTV
jgi:hypothetical protein